MKAPDRIWLQWHGDVWDLDSLPVLDASTDGPSAGDVTWASDRVFDADVEYVRRAALGVQLSPAVLAALADYTAELARLDEMDAGRPDGTHSFESATLDVWLRAAIRAERAGQQADCLGEHTEDGCGCPGCAGCGA